MRHILDPRRLNIVAFYCGGPLIDFSPAILHTTDIREFSSIGLIVDSADDIMPPDDLVRLKEILDYDFNLVGMQVVEEGGHKLGKVGGYTIDSDSFYIVKLQVKPTLLQSFSSAELLIDRTQIREINDNRIVVRKATIKDKVKSNFAPLQSIENPFRKASHLPEAHGADKGESAEDFHPTR